MSFVADLFKGPGNKGWELTRVIGAKAAIVFPFPFIYAVIAKGTIPDPAAWGTGYAAVLLAIGGMIGAKDFAVAKANATTAQAQQPQPTEEKS